MNRIDHREILTTLSNPHWKSDMSFQQMDAQARQQRQSDHDSMMAELKSIRYSFREQGNSEMSKLIDNCIMLYRTGYDL
jgi:hypothetical protein